jgi:hypothetical protein
MSPIPEAIRALFDAPNFVHLSTLRRDVAPRNWIVWVGLEGEQILVCTSERQAKLRTCAAIHASDSQSPTATTPTAWPWCKGASSRHGLITTASTWTRPQSTTRALRLCALL